MHSYILLIVCPLLRPNLLRPAAFPAATEGESKNVAAAASLTPAIMVALTAEPSLNDEGNRIDVDTNEERVGLSGHVKSESLRRLADIVARRVLQDRKERQRLENRLDVKS